MKNPLTRVCQQREITHESIADKNKKKNEYWEMEWKS